MALLDGPRIGPAAGGDAQALVVLLHGVGADGDDLIDLAGEWADALPHAVFFAPNAPHDCDLAPAGRQWFSLKDRTPATRLAGATTARPALDDAIDAELVRWSLPPDRYALMGFSQGAMMALYSGLRRPVPPRCILAYSGTLVAPERLAECTARPPILLVHGVADPVVDFAYSRHAETALQDAGIPVEAVFTPGLGHGIDQAGLALGARMLRSTLGEE